MNIQTDITSSLRAMRADDLLAAADEIGRITEAGRAHIRRAAQFEAERDALRAELARWNAELSAVMPADFKDWTSIPERPQLAAWVIKNLRERLAETDGIAVAADAALRPQAQVKRLTDGQIVGLAIGAGVDSDDEDDDGTTVFAIARAIETACATAWGVKLEGDVV